MRSHITSLHFLLLLILSVTLSVSVCLDKQEQVWKWKYGRRRSCDKASQDSAAEALISPSLCLSSFAVKFPCLRERMFVKTEEGRKAGRENGGFETFRRVRKKKTEKSKKPIFLPQLWHRELFGTSFSGRYSGISIFCCCWLGPTKNNINSRINVVAKRRSILIRV